METKQLSSDHTSTYSTSAKIPVASVQLGHYNLGKAACMHSSKLHQHVQNGLVVLPTLNVRNQRRKPETESQDVFETTSLKQQKSF